MLQLSKSITSYGAMMNKVFISYSHNESDEQFVENLYDDLKARGLQVWVDRRDIRLGQSWHDAIERAIRNANTLLIVGSPTVDESTWVSSEIDLAKRYGKNIVSIIASGGDEALSAVQTFDLDSASIVDAQQDYSAALETISETLTHSGKLDEELSSVKKTPVS